MDITNSTRPAAREHEFDAYAKTYDKAVNQSLGVFGGVGVDYFTRVKAGYIVDLLDRHFGKGARPSMLDVGCGIGNFHSMLGPCVSRLAGCDLSASCLETAAKRNPEVAYSHYDGQRLPYDNDSFDCAITVCVVHHVPPAQWPAFLREMKRVLRPGGLALVFEHNPFNPLTRRVVSNCEFDEDAVLLGQSRMRRLLGDAGFEGVASRSILSLPSFGRLSRKVDALFGRIPLGAQYYAKGTA